MKKEKRKRGAPKGNKNAIGNNGGAPRGNKNAWKTGLYSKIYYQFLDEDEKNIFDNRNIDTIDECKKMIRICDLQIFKFMRLIKNLSNDKFYVQKVSHTDENVKGIQKGERSDYINNKIITDKVATDELIVKYNQEIERAKKQKIKLLELLNKLEPQNKGENDKIIILDDIYGVDNG